MSDDLNALRSAMAHLHEGVIVPDAEQQVTHSGRTLAIGSQLLAHFDPLTGLPNRRMMRERLEQEIKKCQHDQR